MFYTYHQNNSDGEYEYNNNISRYIIVEAVDREESDCIAEGLGVYFDGIDNNIDCPCCGDRWQRASDCDSASEPMVYGLSIQDYTADYGHREFGLTSKDEIIVRVFYKNGFVSEHKLQDRVALTNGQSHLPGV